MPIKFSSFKDKGVFFREFHVIESTYSIYLYGVLSKELGVEHVELISNGAILIPVDEVDEDDIKKVLFAEKLKSAITFNIVDKYY